MSTGDRAVQVSEIRWGTNPPGGRADRYGGRTHVVRSRDRHQALCGLPVEIVHTTRSRGTRLCPECCLAAMRRLFPPREFEHEP